jgi:ubiquinone/menaquinone biosynthesis C-methylase UbiE
MNVHDDSSRDLNYDGLAGTYDRRYEKDDYSGVEEALTAFVGQALDAWVLEVGCGTGHWLRMLGDRGARAAGVDASRAMLTRAAVQAPRARLAQGRADQLPWVDGVFDRLFCINAFHHFEHKTAFLSDARRVLRPDGQLMIIGLDPHTGLDTWYVYEYFEPVLAIDRRRYLATGQVRDWMRGLGYTNVRTWQVQHLPARLAARDAIEQGRLHKHSKSQLAVLTDTEYQQGLDRIYASLARAEAEGRTLYLSSDLRLYATCGSMPAA